MYEKHVNVTKSETIFRIDSERTGFVTSLSAVLATPERAS